MSRSLRSAMMMISRRSEDWKERASRLHSAAALVALAARGQLGQPSLTASCLRRALGHTIKQRFKSERDEWGDESRRAGTAYRAQTFLQAESARAAR